MSVRLNHVFAKGKLLGVQSSDIEEELVIPLSRPDFQKKNRQGTLDNLHLSVSLSQIPKRSFLNRPLLKNSSLGLDPSDANFHSINAQSSNTQDYESYVLVGFTREEIISTCLCPATPTSTCSKWMNGQKRNTPKQTQTVLKGLKSLSTSRCRCSTAA